MRKPLDLVLGLVMLPLLFVHGGSVHAQSQLEVAKTDTNLRRTANKVVTFDRSVAEHHPLWPALELAVGSYKHIRRNVKDYSCDLIRRERVHGRLQQQEFMTAKVRHRRTRGGIEVHPFGVYLRVLAPTQIRGREVLFVSGQHDGDMFVRNGGKRFAFVTTRINPNSDTAMAQNRYPLTEFGFENLVRRLIEVVKEEIQLGAEADVQFFHDAQVDGRICTGVRVTHPTYDSRLRFYTASVFMDDELNVPIHYEAYDWPKEKGGEPVLLERYTYRDIKLNVGYTDRDFDPTNPNYKVQ